MMRWFARMQYMLSSRAAKEAELRAAAQAQHNKPKFSERASLPASSTAKLQTENLIPAYSTPEPVSATPLQVEPQHAPRSTLSEVDALKKIALPTELPVLPSGIQSSSLDSADKKELVQMTDEVVFQRSSFAKPALVPEELPELSTAFMRREISYPTPEPVPEYTAEQVSPLTPEVPRAEPHLHLAKRVTQPELQPVIRPRVKPKLVPVQLVPSEPDKVEEGKAVARHRKVLCVGPHELHNMAYLEWGDPQNSRVLVCVHGLTRNSHDFDYLAQELCKDYRVICPDVAGRGDSDWLANSAHYTNPVYVSDMITLIARLDAKTLDWVGTSMGGLIGMAVASYAESPIRKLVLNDVGAEITAQSLRRLGKYAGRATTFASKEEALAYFKDVCVTFGPQTEEQWWHLTEHSIKQNEAGQYIMKYDPAIGDTLRMGTPLFDFMLWPIYDLIKCPTMVIRGAESDLLTAAVVEKMTRRGPKATAVEIPGVGHAPTLMNAEQIDIVKQYLLKD